MQSKNWLTCQVTSQECSSASHAALTFAKFVHKTSRDIWKAQASPECCQASGCRRVQWCWHWEVVDRGAPQPQQQLLGCDHQQDQQVLLALRALMLQVQTLQLVQRQGAEDFKKLMRVDAAGSTCEH